MTEQPKAYSYLRFSTPEQSKGDSHRRQSKLATDYAQRHQLQLDEQLTFHDLGVSAYRGMNVETGRLADFLKAVHVGLVKQGSYLLVESLDRLSRQAARKALRALEDICDAGITVVTLSDNREYTKEALDSDPTSLLMSILIFMRANEESATKARRLRAAWEGKRATASNRVLTAVCPAWLTLNRGAGKFVIIPERAAIIQRIFYETLQGCSPHSIALALNVECVPVFGRGKIWHRSYVIKILANAAVVGTMTPHTAEYPDGKKVRRPMEQVTDYYPAVIDNQTFQRVQSLRLGTFAPMRGKHAGKEVTNIFGGLGRCARCGATMTRVNKGRGAKQWHYLVCTAAKAGAGCFYQNIPYDQVEKAFIDNAAYLIAKAPSGDKGKAIDAEIKKVEAQLEGVSDGLEILLNELQRAPSNAIRVRIKELEAERDELNEQLGKLADRHAETSGPLVRSKLADLREAATTKPLNRTLLNSVLRQAITRVDIDIDTGLLLFHWKHGGESELLYAWPKEAKRA